MDKSINILMQEAIDRKMDDGTLEKLFDEQVHNILSKAIDDCFSWSSPVHKLLRDKVNSLMTSSIEKSDFDSYIVKITDVLNKAFKNTNLSEYKTITKNLEELLGPAENLDTTVDLGVIYDKYNSFIAEFFEDKKYEFNDNEIEEDCESEYGFVNIDTSLKIVPIKNYFEKPLKYIVTLSCSKDIDNEDLTVSFVLQPSCIDKGKKYVIFDKDYRLKDIRSMSDFEVYLLKLSQRYVNVNIDVDDDICESIVCTFTED